MGVGAGVSVGGKRVTMDDDEVVGFGRSDIGGESSAVSIKVDYVDYIMPSRELPAT